MNKLKLTTVLIFVFLYSWRVTAQIENVVVEKYYISDSIDETDVTGGFLESGSTTYRVFIDLATGYKLSKIYGDLNHPLKISSTEIFFNNVVDGQSYGKDFSKSRLSENTVALDSWLTIGQVTKSISKQHGVLKTYDSDGSFVGGVNNDGGSASIAAGLIANTDPLAGIPVTVSDGNDTLTVSSGSWFDYGILSSNGDDSTIFGSIVPQLDFIGSACGLQYSGGVHGVNADSNMVLVAQLTTKGEISFELNLELVDTNGNITKFVANDSVLLSDEIYIRKLKYPYDQICGCPDTRYLEYLADRDCNSLDSCKNVIVFGCMDTTACNYNSDANVNVQNLCCFPGRCSDRDLALVCPQLLINRNENILNIELYPNPANEFLSIHNLSNLPIMEYSIINAIGQTILVNNDANTDTNVEVNTASLESGIYLLVVKNNSAETRRKFIKN